MDEPVPDPRPQSLQQNLPVQNLPVQNLPVIVQPDPAFEEHGGVMGTVAMSLGALAIVVLVLYGITRPEAPEQTASAPAMTTPAQPAPGNAQPPKPQPSTTGQAK
jgi:hypothetical protein